MEVLRETKCRVRAGGEVGESFWTARGVRQGCPLLFNILIADIEEKMGKVKWWGNKTGRKENPDMMFLAEEEESMRSMIGRLEDYLDEKRS